MQAPRPFQEISTPLQVVATVHPGIGIGFLLFAVAAFASVAHAVVANSVLTLLDVRIAYWFHVHATTPVTMFMMVITQINSIGGTLFMTGAAGMYLWTRKQGYWLLCLVISVVGVDLLNVLFKHLFQRIRPSFDHPLLTLATYSFPSGHTAGSTAFYGVLACYACSLDMMRGSRFWLPVAAIGMILLVGLSRVYLGVHYFSDVIGAMAEAGAWLALTLTTASMLRYRLGRSVRARAIHG